MLKWIETTGRSEEDAISAALFQLGLDRDDVSVEVIERAKSGFLGFGGNPAKVRVSYEEENGKPVPKKDLLEEEAVPASAPIQERQEEPAAPQAEETVLSAARSCPGEGRARPGGGGGDHPGRQAGHVRAPAPAGAPGAPPPPEGGAAPGGGRGADGGPGQAGRPCPARPADPRPGGRPEGRADPRLPHRPAGASPRPGRPRRLHHPGGGLSGHPPGGEPGGPHRPPGRDPGRHPAADQLLRQPGPVQAGAHPRGRRGLPGQAGGVPPAAGRQGGGQGGQVPQEHDPGAHERL